MYDADCLVESYECLLSLVGTCVIFYLVFLTFKKLYHLNRGTEKSGNHFVSVSLTIFDMSKFVVTLSKLNVRSPFFAGFCKLCRQVQFNFRFWKRFFYSSRYCLYFNLRKNVSGIYFIRTDPLSLLLTPVPSHEYCLALYCYDSFFGE